MQKGENTKNMAEGIIKNVTLIYGFLIFCGSLYFHFYYYAFNINIFRYLDLGEISVSFLHILIPIIGVIGVLIAYFFLFKKVIEEFTRKKTVDKSFEEIIKEEKNNIRIQSIWVGVLVFICAAFLFLSNERVSTRMWLCPSPYREFICICFCLIPMVLTIKKYDLKFIIVNTALIFVMASVYNAMSDIKLTMDLARNDTYVIITKSNDTIRTNNSFYFVGRTNQFIFLYDSLNNINIYLPDNDVKKYYVIRNH